MRRLLAWVRRVLGTAASAARSRELSDEIESHIELHVADLVRSGVSRAEARRQALLALGGVDQTKEHYRDRRGLPGLAALGQELRLAVRGAVRARRFTALAVLTLALGIGANVALFSVVYGVLIRPLDYYHSDRLVAVRAERSFTGRPTPIPSNFSYPDLQVWQATGQAFDSMAMSYGVPVLLSSAAGNEVIPAANVTPAFFPTLGGRFYLGRGLGPADAQSPSVVVSRRLWQRIFADAPDLGGATIQLDGASWNVVGVIEASFQIPNRRVDVWRPVEFASIANPLLTKPRAGGFQLFARLAPGHTIAEAQGQADSVSRSMDVNLRSTVISLREQAVPVTTSRMLLLLWAAVGLVLLVSCANVANLILARQSSRSREFAISMALGASRGRLVARAMAQTGLLSGVGCVAGVGFAMLLLRLVQAWAPAGLPRLDAVRIDVPVLLFACVITLLAAGVVGAITAFPVGEITAALRVSSSLATGRRGRRIRGALVIAQVAVAIVLLVGGVLVGRSLARLMQTDIGISRGAVTAALIDTSFGQTSSLAQQRSRIDRVVAEVGRLPGVTAVGAGASLPPNLARLRFTLQQLDEAIGKPTNYMVDAVTATPGYFAALGIRLREGRLFTDADAVGHPQVMILTRTTGRQIFGDRDPIGREVHLPRLTDEGQDNVAVTVVGVIDDVKYSGLDTPSNGVIFRPFAQQPWSSMFIVARTEVDDAGLIATLRKTISRVDPSVAIHSIDTMDALVNNEVALPRFRTGVLGSLAVLVLTLAGLGLYGVMAYAVMQRTSEIGVRMALGADRSSIVRLVAIDGLRLAGWGVAIGTGLAWLAARTLTSFLFDVGPTDPWSFSAAIAVVGIVMAGATYVPTRRAMRIEPVVALRAE